MRLVSLQNASLEQDESHSTPNMSGSDSEQVRTPRLGVKQIDDTFGRRVSPCDSSLRFHSVMRRKSNEEHKPEFYQECYLSYSGIRRYKLLGHYSNSTR